MLRMFAWNFGPFCFPVMSYAQKNGQFRRVRGNFNRGIKPRDQLLPYERSSERKGGLLGVGRWENVARGGDGEGGEREDKELKNIELSSSTTQHLELVQCWKSRQSRLLTLSWRYERCGQGWKKWNDRRKTETREKFCVFFIFGISEK